KDQSLHSIAMRPPPVPELAHIIAAPFSVGRQIWGLEESGQPKENCFGIVRTFAQQFQRCSLRNQSKRQFVFFVTKGSSDFLEKRFLSTVVFDFYSKATGLLLQTKLTGSIQHAVNLFLREIF